MKGQVIVLPVVRIERERDFNAMALDALVEIFPEVKEASLKELLVQLHGRGLHIVPMAPDGAA